MLKQWLRQISQDAKEVYFDLSGMPIPSPQGNSRKKIMQCKTVTEWKAVLSHYRKGYCFTHVMIKYNFKCPIFGYFKSYKE